MSNKKKLSYTIKSIMDLNYRVSVLVLEIFLIYLVSVVNSSNPIVSSKLGLPQTGENWQDSLYLQAQCHANCLFKFLNPNAYPGSKLQLEIHSTCSENTECSICLETCVSLEASWKSEAVTSSTKNSRNIEGVKLVKTLETGCSHSRLCLSGCQVACRFWDNLTQKNFLKKKTGGGRAPLTLHREHVLTYTENERKIQWKEPKNEKILHSIPFVYILIQKLPNQKWKEIIQTTETETEVPAGFPNLHSLRVLVVGPNGLVAIYYPEIAQSPVTNLQQPKSSTTTQKAISTSSISTLFLHNWNLHKVSLIHQKFLVIAELEWNGVPGAKDYLITWELDGGGLKGHLVTDSTTVTLSLWPDTLYHIQVELFGGEEEGKDTNLELERKSFSLAVDTSEASFPSSFSPVAGALREKRRESSHKSVTEFLHLALPVTVSSLLLVFLCLGVALYFRKTQRCSRDPGLLDHMEEPSSTLQTVSDHRGKTTKITTGVQERVSNSIHGFLSVAVISPPRIFKEKQQFEPQFLLPSSSSSTKKAMNSYVFLEHQHRILHQHPHSYP